MEVMYLLIAFSLLIASGFLLAFMWAVRSGQYDDRYTPSVRILLDDIRPGKKDVDAAGSRGDAVEGDDHSSDDHGDERDNSGTKTGSIELLGINKNSGGDAAGSRGDAVKGDDHRAQRDASGTRAGSTEQAGINKSITGQGNEKNSSTGLIDGIRKAGFNGKPGRKPSGGSPAAAIRPQEHHLKTKTRR